MPDTWDFVESMMKKHDLTLGKAIDIINDVEMRNGKCDLILRLRKGEINDGSAVTYLVWVNQGSER